MRLEFFSHSAWLNDKSDECLCLFWQVFDLEFKQIISFQHPRSILSKRTQKKIIARSKMTNAHLFPKPTRKWWEKFCVNLHAFNLNCNLFWYLYSFVSSTNDLISVCMCVRALAHIRTTQTKWNTFFFIFNIHKKAPNKPDVTSQMNYLILSAVEKNTPPKQQITAGSLWAKQPHGLKLWCALFCLLRHFAQWPYSGSVHIYTLNQKKDRYEIYY